MTTESTEIMSLPITLRFTNDVLEVPSQIVQYIGRLSNDDKPDTTVQSIQMPQPYQLNITAIVLKFLAIHQIQNNGAAFVESKNVLMPETYPPCSSWAKTFFTTYQMSDLTAAVNVAHFLNCAAFVYACSAYIAEVWTTTNFYDIAKCFTGSNDSSNIETKALLIPFLDSQAHQDTYGDILFASETEDN